MFALCGSSGVKPISITFVLPAPSANLSAPEAFSIVTYMSVVAINLLIMPADSVKESSSAEHRMI